jgi:serine/threonine-protein kinase
VSQNCETFGKYILLEKVATGGMAEVYLARSTGASGVGKFVGIKRILPQFSEQTEFIDMFKDEAKIAINLSHSNIVSIHEFGMEKSQFFLVMDFVEGRNLRQILNKMKKSGVSFSIEQVLYIIREIAAGLDHAHRCLDANTGKPLNIIHRDMSPQNAMVSFEGEVKIVDFGIAKAETQLETTRAGTLKGKFGYMSPEQAEGQSVDLRTDVFSLGIVLWELLANDRLFVSNNEVNTLRKIRDCQIPSLRKINPNIPPELERIVAKALAKDKNLRYQTSAALHRELSRFLNRQYPDFSPQDFAIFIKTLFAGEILENRRKMVEFAKVDARAPEAPTSTVSLTDRLADKTVVTSSFNDKPGALPSTAPNPAAKNDARNDTRNAASEALPDAPSNVPAPLDGSKLPPSGLRIEKSGVLQRLESSYPGAAGMTVPMGTRSISQPVRGSAPKRKPVNFSYLSLIFTLAGLLLLAVGAGYVYQNPKPAAVAVFKALKSLGVPVPETAVKKETQTTENASTDAVPNGTVRVASSPPGAEVIIDGKRSGEVTPAALSFAEKRNVNIRVQMQGYLPFEQTIQVQPQSAQTLEPVLVPAGSLDVVVQGAGEITINDKLYQAPGPFLVPADQDLLVVVKDPATGAFDQQAIRLRQYQSARITLIPRAGDPSRARPSGQPPGQPINAKSGGSSPGVASPGNPPEENAE